MCAPDLPAAIVYDTAEWNGKLRPPPPSRVIIAVRRYGLLDFAQQVDFAPPYQPPIFSIYSLA